MVEKLLKDFLFNFANVYTYFSCFLMKHKKDNGLQTKTNFLERNPIYEN